MNSAYSAPTTTVIILAFNNGERLTVPCVESVLEYTDPDLYDLLVFDNGSTDNTGQLMRDRGVACYSAPENIGFSGGNNQAAFLTESDNIVFMNNDVVAHPGWLEPMLAALTDDVGIVGSKLLYPDGRIQHAGVYFTGDGPLLGHHYLTEQPAGLVPAVTAACMLIRRDAFNDVGGFDTAYKMGNEDVDLNFKVRDAGWKVWYEPASVLTHHESQSADRWDHTPANIALLTERWLHLPHLWAGVGEVTYRAIER